MPSTTDSVKPGLLVLASTYPRWAGDYEPSFVHRLCEELAEHYEVTVLTPISPGAAKTEKLGQVNIYRFSYAPHKLQTLIHNGGMLENLKRQPLKWLLVPFYIISMTFAIKKLATKLHPVAIHCHWIVPQGFALWLTSKIARLPPFLITSHGGDLYGLSGRLGTWLKKKVVCGASAVTVVSHPMMPIALRLGAPSGRTFVAPMGASLTNPNEASISPSRVKGRILFVGRLVEKKGLIYLIKAMPAVVATLPDCELVIIGDGPEKGELRKAIRNLNLDNHVRLLGALPQEQLPQYYLTASLFCAPFVKAKNGDVEGLGLVTVEAINFGCPVLVGDVDAVGDVIPENFRDSCVTDPKLTQEFSERIIQKMMAQNLNKEIECLKSFVTDRFSWKGSGNSYRVIIENIASESCN